MVASQKIYGAAREAGLDRLPVIIKRRLSDQQALELMREITLYLGHSASPYQDDDQSKALTRFLVA